MSRYALYYTMAQDKSGLDVDRDSLIRYAYDFYKLRPSDSLYAKCHYYMGKYYLLNDSNKLAEDCFRSSISKSATQGDLYTQYLATEKLGKSLQSSNPSAALDLARQARLLYLKCGRYNLYNDVFLLINIGNSFQTAQVQDSVLPYMKKAMALAERSDNPELKAHSYQSLSVAYSTSDADSAIHYARKAWQNPSCRSVSMLMQLASCYQAVDSLEQASSLLRDATLSVNENTRYAAFRRLAQIAWRTGGNTSLYKEYTDSAFVSLTRMYLQSQAERSEYYIDNSRAELEILSGKLEQQRQENLLLLLIISALVLLFLAVVYYVLHARSARKLLDLQAANEITEERLKIEQEANDILEKQSRLDRAAKEVFEEKLEIERKSRELIEEKLKVEQEANARDRKRELEHQRQSEKQLSLMRSYILEKADFYNIYTELKSKKKISEISDDDWFQIESYLNESSSDFVILLRERFPHLKENDVRYCMLLRLGFKNTELERFFGIQLQSVKHNLQILRTKLKITDSGLTARQYIQNFS